MPCPICGKYLSNSKHEDVSIICDSCVRNTKDKLQAKRQNHNKKDIFQLVSDELETKKINN